MKRKLQYINIEYSKKDESYIEELIEYIEKNLKEIVQFLNIKNKVEIKIWNNLLEYRKRNFKISNNIGNSVEDVIKWSCRFTYDMDNIIYIEMNI